MQNKNPDPATGLICQIEINSREALAAKSKIEDLEFAERLLSSGFALRFRMGLMDFQETLVARSKTLSKPSVASASKGW